MRVRQLKIRKIKLRRFVCLGLSAVILAIATPIVGSATNISIVGTASFRDEIVQVWKEAGD
jgi:hypothetical protein